MRRAHFVTVLLALACIVLTILLLRPSLQNAAADRSVVPPGGTVMITAILRDPLGLAGGLVVKASNQSNSVSPDITYLNELKPGVFQAVLSSISASNKITSLTIEAASGFGQLLLTPLSLTIATSRIGLALALPVEVKLTDKMFIGNYTIHFDQPDSTLGAKDNSHRFTLDLVEDDFDGDLAHFITTMLSGAVIESTQEVSVDGISSKQVTYSFMTGPEQSDKSIEVFIPADKSIYRVGLAFSGDDPNVTQILELLKSTLAGLHIRGRR